MIWSNLTKEQRTALKEPRGLEDEVILPADKGNATVMMRRCDYDGKMEEMLGTGTYGKLRGDPTATQENRLSRKLKGLEKNGEIRNALYNKLRPTGSQPPRIYGLPKIHKPDIPLRPIVSCIGSPTYQLSKHITSLISPLAGHTSSHVKNSRHFTEMMGSVHVESDEILVSFDVSSLFTNVPVGEAVSIIHKRLMEDETLGDRTSLSPERIADLLEMCLRSTYFSFGGNFYEQKEGAAMGSPVSAVVANLYMEFFEELALDTAPTRPRLWKRYVDDTFCILRKGSTKELLHHLNGVRPTIKFTVEQEEDGTLPFLDTLLRRREDGSLDVSVYRKPMHTDRYLHFESHHPTHVKRGVVRCLHDRAGRVISTQDNLQKEVDHLARVLKQNGYPANFIRNASTPPTQETADVSSPEEEQEKGPLVVIPYVVGMSEDIRCVCRKFNIRVVFKSGRTLRSMLTKVKDTLPPGKQSNVVYRIPCSCGQVYIGETKRRLEMRLKEHRDACERGMMEKSAVAEHVWEHHHPIHWEETTVLDHGRRQELLMKEALHIQMTPVEERFNRDGGLEVPGCWTAVMRRQGGAILTDL